VAKPNYQQLKRQKEVARKDRRQSKLERKTQKPAEASESVPPVGSTPPDGPTLE
jgi:hypothetical protein